MVGLCENCEGRWLAGAGGRPRCIQAGLSAVWCAPQSRTPSTAYVDLTNQRSADMVRLFVYPLLPYRSFFYPFLVVSAIAVPCWLAFRLYRRRALGHRVSLAREILLLTAVLYLSGLAAATLTISRPSRSVAEATAAGVDLHPNLTSLTCHSASMRPGSTAHSFCVRNARGNVVLFIPLGILIPLIWRRLRFWKAVLLALAFSVGIEVVQYISRAWGSHRTADVNDVILNSVGACLGLVFVFVLRLMRRSRPSAPRA